MNHLVLFDIDGTLLWSRGCGRAAIAPALREVFGFAGDIARHPFAGKTDWQIVVELVGADAGHVGARMAAFEQAAYTHLAQIISNYAVQACPGALALVTAVAQQPDIVLGLLTGNLRTTAPVKLRAAGFDPEDFCVGAYGSDAPWRHELPAIAAGRAQDLTGIPFAGAHITIIGDTPNDVQCGQPVGARSIAVLTGAGSRAALEAASPDYLFEDLTDTQAVLAAVRA